MEIKLLANEELNQIKGGYWIWIDGSWFWIEDGVNKIPPPPFANNNMNK